MFLLLRKHNGSPLKTNTAVRQTLVIIIFWYSFESTQHSDVNDVDSCINYYVEGLYSPPQDSDRPDSSPHKQPLVHSENETGGIKSRSDRSGDEERNFLPAPSPTKDIQTAVSSFYWQIISDGCKVMKEKTNYITS